MARRRRRALLVVAANEDFRVLLTSLLEQAGYGVAQASSPEMALDVLRKVGNKLPHAVVEAVSPGADKPWRLVQALRLDPDSSLATVRLIMSSDRDKPLDRLRAWELGVDGWVVRPHHINEVIDEIEAALERPDKRLAEYRSERFEAVRREVAEAKQR